MDRPILEFAHNSVNNIHIREKSSEAKRIDVTLGLCVKNCAATIKKTIKSILNQDYPHELTEIIVVDDRSEDETLSILTESISIEKSLRVKVFTGKNSLGKSRQIVVDNACGKYIVWVDGDITMERGHIQKQVEFMDQNPRVGKARGKWKPLYETSLPATFENMGLIDYESRHTRPNRTATMLVGIGGSICRLEALLQVGGFDENIAGAGEDIDVAARMLKAGWLLRFSDAEFFHKQKDTWKGLLKQSFWYGYGGHYVSHRHKDLVSIWTMTPPVAFVSGVLSSFAAYKSMYRKICFMLPIVRFIKQAVWSLGFIKSHFDRYGHAAEPARS